jgi:hypothetical protein
MTNRRTISTVGTSSSTIHQVLRKRENAVVKSASETYIGLRVKA